MLQWFRVRASRVAAVLLVSVAALGASHAAPHQDDCHDAACATVAVPHDASAHQVRSPSPATDNHPLHCLVCHWVRSFRPRPEVRIVSAPAIQTGVRLHVESFTAPAAATVAQPPLRSPPASPVLA